MFCSHTHPTKAQRCHLPRPQPEPELRRERNARLSLLSHPTTNPRASPQPRGSRGRCAAHPLPMHSRAPWPIEAFATLSHLAEMKPEALFLLRG